MGIPVVPDLTKLTAVSHFVDDLANCAHNVRAPFVGSTAFSHKGGMHVNAVQKLARSYEHIGPEAVGNRQHILVSELSGQSNILLKAEELGFPLEKGAPEVGRILERTKRREKEGYEFEAADGSFELLIRKSWRKTGSFSGCSGYHTTFRQRRRPQLRELRGDGEADGERGAGLHGGGGGRAGQRARRCAAQGADPDSIRRSKRWPSRTTRCGSSTATRGRRRRRGC